MKGSERTISRPALELAMMELFGAERRLRTRDQQSRHLTTTQLRALHALARDEAVAAGQLAKSANLNPATVTGMLDNLEEMGIVERHSDSRDRRMCMVSLTETGRTIVSERRARWEALWSANVGVLTDEERDAAEKAFRAIASVLDSM